MSLTTIVKDLNEIPEQYRDLYEKKGEQFEITGIAGIKTQGDVDRVQVALGKERDVSKALKGRLTAFGDNTAESIQTMLDANEDLTVKVAGLERDGGPNKDDIAKQVESGTIARIRPIERQLAAATKALDDITGQRDRLSADRDRGKIVQAVTNAGSAKDIAVQKDVVASGDLGAWGALNFELSEDGEVLSREGVPGLIPGLSPEEALISMKEGGTRGYWFGITTGAGASGGRGGSGTETGVNPFGINEATKTPNNLTRAAALMKSDPARAKRLFQSASAKDSSAASFFPSMAATPQ